MKKLDEWAKNKPIALAIIAQQIAISAEPCTKFLKLLKVGDQIEKYHKFPSYKEWLRYYKNHRILNDYLINTFKKFGEIAEIGTELAELLSLNRKKRRQLESTKFLKIGDVRAECAFIYAFSERTPANVIGKNKKGI